MWDRLENFEMRRRSWRGGPDAPGPRPDPAQPPGTDRLPQLAHIVVLMMENHSYDNYLGLLRGRGDGLPVGPDGAPTAVNPDAAGRPVRAARLASTRQGQLIPSQSWRASHAQWAGGAGTGFVTSAEQVLAEAAAAGKGAATVPAGGGVPDDPAATMGYWTEDDLPFYYGLARTFPLADRWFSSCLGPTFPNRRFLIAGTAHGLVDDSPYDLLDYPPAGTIFDLLTRHDISWANYHPVAADRSQAARYALHRHKMARRRALALGRSLGAANQDVQKDLQFTADVFPVGTGRYAEHVRSTDDFFAAADAGTLPGFSIVDPDFSGFSEENPQDIRRGESFAAEVIGRVMHGPGWPRTVLIWVYDEAGGYYDHVPPPAAVPPDDVPARSLVGTGGRLDALLRPLRPGLVAGKREETGGPRRYDRYGFRVPAVIVSPYARPDFVLSTVLDHTSVLRLVEDKWNLPALTRRDAAAASPVQALDLGEPPAFLVPPELPAPALAWGSW
jgi:phospholipase C